jgi:hypothetical protein
MCFVRTTNAQDMTPRQASRVHDRERGGVESLTFIPRVVSTASSKSSIHVQIVDRLAVQQVRRAELKE